MVLFTRGVSITRKLGFSDVIMPGRMKEKAPRNLQKEAFSPVFAPSCKNAAFLASSQDDGLMDFPPVAIEGVRGIGAICDITKGFFSELKSVEGNYSKT